MRRRMGVKSGSSAPFFLNGADRSRFPFFFPCPNASPRFFARAILGPHLLYERCEVGGPSLYPRSTHSLLHAQPQRHSHKGYLQEALDDSRAAWRHGPSFFVHHSKRASYELWSQIDDIQVMRNRSSLPPCRLSGTTARRKSAWGDDRRTAARGSAKRFCHHPRPPV